jgi:adenosylcobyric acid synthase
MFRDDGFRAAFLAGLGAIAATRYDAGVEATLDALAAHIEAHLDVSGLLSVDRLREGDPCQSPSKPLKTLRK